MCSFWSLFPNPFQWLLVLSRTKMRLSAEQEHEGKRLGGQKWDAMYEIIFLHLAPPSFPLNQTQGYAFMFISLLDGNAKWNWFKCLLCSISSLGSFWNVESQWASSDGTFNTHWHWHDIKTYAFRVVLEVIPSDSLFLISSLASF